MDGIITIIIIFFVLNTVFRLFKRMGQPAKKNPEQAQAQPEAARPRPVPKPVVRQDDFRFPPVPKAASAPIAQEGRNPDEELTFYTPIAPSADLHSQLTDYQGSLGGVTSEGAGYQSEAYEPTAVPYRTDLNARIKVLPERFTRDTLLQAVVMSEILRRPGARR